MLNHADFVVDDFFSKSLFNALFNVLDFNGAGFFLNIEILVHERFLFYWF